MKTNDTLQITGNWNFAITEGKPLTSKEIEQIRNGLPTERPVDLFSKTNVVTLAFRSRLAELLSRPPADPAKLFRLTHQELGTGTTPASELDINLEAGDNSTLVLLADVVPNGKEIQVTGFYGEGDASGHWKEYGIWLNGDNGDKTLFNRINIDRQLGGSSSLSIFGTINLNI